jgi:hypothetical protein
MLALLLLAGASLSAPVVITSEATPEEAVSVDTVRRLCLGQSTFLGETRVELLLPLDNSPSMAELLSDWVDMSASEYARHWLRVSMSGRGVPPEQLSDEAAVRYVLETPGAVAIVSPRTLPDGVKALAIRDD